MTALFDHVRRYPRFSVAGLMLLLAVGVTVAARWHVQQEPLDAHQARSADIVRHTFQSVEERFTELYTPLQERARALANDTLVQRAIQTHAASVTRPDELFQRVESLRSDARSSVEVYDATGRLLAWSGRHIPQAWPPPADANAPHTTVASDGDILDALVVWWPIQSTSPPSTHGWVRLTYSVRYDPPIRNRYLQGYSLQQTWRDATGEPLSVHWGTDRPSSSQSPARILRGLDGTPLGVVRMAPPPPQQVVREMVQRYDALLAFWTTVLLAWLLGGLWYQYGRAMRASPPQKRPSWSAIGWFGAAATTWITTRFLLLRLDVPVRWLPREGGIATLFDPTHLASTFGGGLMRSTGDLLLTSLFASVLSVALLHLMAPLRYPINTVSDLLNRLPEEPPAVPSALRFVLVFAALVGGALAMVALLTQVVRRAVLDSTLEFFSRSGLLPDPLVLVVLCALFLLVLAVLLGTVACMWGGLHLLVRYRPVHWPRGMLSVSIAATLVLGIGGMYMLVDGEHSVPLVTTMTFLGMATTGALFGLVWPHGGLGQLTLRGLLPSILALTILLYPMLYVGIETQRRDHMEEAAASFEAGRDPRVLFAIEQVLRLTRPLLDQAPGPVATLPVATVDSLATQAVRGSLLPSLTAYEASLVIGAGDQLLHRYATAGIQMRRTPPTEPDRVVVSILRVLMDARGTRRVVEQLHDRQQLRRSTEERLQYAGMGALSADSLNGGPPAWVMLRVEPRSLLPGAGTNIPRVLLPDGSFSDLYADLSLAEFRNGVLDRSLGRNFGRAQLQPRVQNGLADGTAHWMQETVRGRDFFTYYRQTTDVSSSVIAVRIPAILAFDHLYHLLRLTVAGLCVAALIYVLGAWVRYRRGLLPTQQIRFRDKVLNAFLIVGVVSMISVGVVGVQVVTSENNRVVERRLQDQMSRVEETLALDARPGEPLYGVGRRLSVDSLAARVGLDLRLYNATRLGGTSRPRLVRDRLVDQRLSADVYRSLYNDSYRFTVAPERVGKFEYRVGYRALTDAQGHPRLIIAIPTLAQQERLEEEQARTLAYLFGALLLLVVVVMLTALLLSNALAQPIAQLRKGLEAVGEGRFARVLPVNTRDEIGDLVRTFNDMRDQLAESRRKLAQQERELAWREMARQVAHEIKNPLTPMKLSIQHLRRAFPRRDLPDDARFLSLFDRITTTLVEQIEALARIANEFSTFARLPTRVPEPLDLNEVLEEAVRLMREEETDMSIQVDLHADPLVVEADREELRRIYINLLKNAIQAIPEDTEGIIQVHTERTTKRTVSDTASQPYACSTVSDNGTGIPVDLQDKIFQPNFSTKTSGTGLGLAIAKKGIEELDGTIGFETSEGKGTTFRIRLPLTDDAPSSSNI